MKGSELRRFREEQGWSQEDAAKLFKSTLGKGSSTTVGKWESGQRPVPEDVARLVAQIQLESAMPGDKPLDEETLGLGPEPELGFAAPPVEGGAGDTAPPEPTEGQASGGQPPVVLPSSSTYGKVCTELWEMIGTGVGVLGAGIGSDALRADGAIILADAPALGRAWGKLAETNDTFRRMLLGATSGGAWLELGLVTGATATKLIRSHQEQAARRLAERERLQAEWDAEHGQEGEYGFAEPAAA